MKDKQLSSGAYGVRRTDLKYTLCFRWVERHRPDVLEAIQNEVDKKFPLRGGRRKRPIVLPPALVDME